MIFTFFALLLTLCLSLPSSALAQSPTTTEDPSTSQTPLSANIDSDNSTGFSISISPAFQEIELEAGNSTSETVLKLTNHTDQPLDLELFALDFEQLDENGQISLINKPSSPDQFAQYISFPKRRITIPANDSISVPVTITNSLDFSPGGHYAAVVARFTKQDTPELQQVLPGVSSLLLVHKLGGAFRHLSIVESNLQHSFVTFKKPKTLSLVFSNQGNIHAIPRGKITYTDLFGRSVFQGIINENSHYVLPQTRRKIEVVLNQVRPEVPFMLYTVETNGSSEGSITFQQQYYLVYISPWFAAILIGLTLGSSYGFRRRLWKKISTHKQKPSN